MRNFQAEVISHMKAPRLFEFDQFMEASVAGAWRLVESQMRSETQEGLDHAELGVSREVWGLLHLLKDPVESCGQGCGSILSMLLSFFFFGLFWAAPTAYGNSQARGPIKAAAAGLHHSHSNSGSKLRL